MVWLPGLAALIVLLAATPSASADSFPHFGKFCLGGPDAGDCQRPRGVVTDPVSGHVYMADQINGRIDEFTAWGKFVKAWGWGVKDGSLELQVCTTETGCQEGGFGAGPGQFSFNGAQGVALDSAGNIYVVDRNNFRVQKFSPDGEFLLMFGGGVDQGPNHPGDVCTAVFIAEGDTCGAGSTGTANGQFASNWSYSSYIAIAPDDQIYVGDSERIQVFDTEGVYQRQLPIPQPGVVGELAVDPVSGDLYMGYLNGRTEEQKTLPNVYRLDHTTGAVINTLEVTKPAALAVDSGGNVFVFDQNLIVGGNPEAPGSHLTRILVFDPSGKLTDTIVTEVAGQKPGEKIALSTGLATGSACFGEGKVGLYVSAIEVGSSYEHDYLQAFSSTPDPAKCAPPEAPPSIGAQYATTVDSESAVLKAQINAHYFTEAVGTTTYRVQWASQACIDGGGWEAGCVKESPIPAAKLIAVPVDADVPSGGVLLSSLAPNTGYRYRFVAERFVAESEVPAEEAVIGVGGEPGAPGKDAAFTTLPEPSTPAPCANDSRRLGPAAGLRDCRAYELVSPLEKEGGDIQARLNLVPFEARMDQAAGSGDAITYSAYRAFGNAQSAPFTSQYLAQRDSAAGWQSEAISPPQEGEAFISPLIQVDNLYRAFSADLAGAWLQTASEPVLGSGGLPGHFNLYRRDNGASSYSGCTTLPPQLEEQAHGPQLQGFSTDGQLGVFRIENKLTDSASGAASNYQLYACAYPEGAGTAVLRLVSALPDGSPSERQNTIGGPANELFQADQGRTESLQNAVSADGSKVYWTASNGVDAEWPGSVYLRENPGAEPTLSGACDEAGKACTLVVSESVPGVGPSVEARFWLASRDGAKAIFSIEDLKSEAIPVSPLDKNLYEYDAAGGASTLIAREVIGVLGASEDAARVYFLSREKIAGSGQGGGGEEAVEGEPNLYLHEVGSTSAFIGTLSEEDTVKTHSAPGPANPEPAWHTARVSPDGATLAFMSNDTELAEAVAGYDNTDQVGGIPAAEIYRFAIGEDLACVSCNRSGQRPSGGEIQNQHQKSNPPRYAGSLLPPWLNSLYAQRVLSEDGKRIFFEAFEPLVLNDTNGKVDVYEWEQLGTGTCTEADSTYNPQNGGCLSLLSSGKSTTDSHFVDASPDGRDVFIRTASSLVAWDPGQIDIYDAREGGGFPPPTPPPASCEGEACQSPTPAPNDPTPASVQEGPGNLQQQAKPRRCAKGKHKVKKNGKTRCVKNKKAKKSKRHKSSKHKKHANKSGRASR